MPLIVKDIFSCVGFYEDWKIPFVVRKVSKVFLVEYVKFTFGKRKLDILCEVLTLEGKLYVCFIVCLQYFQLCALFQKNISLNL